MEKNWLTVTEHYDATRCYNEPDAVMEEFLAFWPDQSGKGNYDQMDRHVPKPFSLEPPIQTKT